MLFALTVALGAMGASGAPGRVAEAAGDHLESDLFGITIGWDSAWAADDAYEADGNVSIYLTKGDTLVTFRAAPSFGGNEHACLDSVVDNIGQDPSVSEIDTIGSDATLPFTGGTSLQLAFEWDLDDGPADQWQLHAWCRTLQRGYSTLEVRFFTPSATRRSAMRDADGLTVEETGEAPVPDFAYAEEQDDLTGFWTQQFDAWGEDPYAPPSYFAFSDRQETLCGLIGPLEIGWFYCPYDLVVYADGPLTDEYAAKYGHGINVFLTAHETAHHVAMLLDPDWCDPLQCVTAISSLQFELLADCFAGAWMANAEARGTLLTADIDAALAGIADSFGDPTHGTATARLWWLLQGYQLGVDACLVDAAE